MRQVRTKAMDDIPIGVPSGLPKPIDRQLFDLVNEHAGMTRGEGLRLARQEIAKHRTATLKTVILLLKLMVFERTGQILGEMAQASPKVDCRAGCTACCHQNVEVSIPEAILVALRVADPADPRRQAILETADAVANLDSIARARTGRPCPLLVEGKCSVYEDRPLMCRAVLSPDARKCHEELNALLHGTDSTGIEIYPVPQFFAHGDKAAICGICKDLGLQYDTVDLVQTVAAILRDPTTVDRWATGERVFTARPPVLPAPIA